ncbi:unnamed protein product [Lactuca saligna]|uniref:MULE transposase domain-containing protein n=1 Tax=Lactuca saligna TaxID=75948 RepID=A0AA35ZIA4_LACSI|nr:unnamed protein product [Lactuca saligna]
MASTSGTKKPKGPKLPEKIYLPDSDSDEDAFDFSFLDFFEETFKAPSRLCDDQFLNLLCDENHVHLDEGNEDVGMEYRVHDLNVDWKEMRPRLGDCYESPAQLRDNNDNNKMQCPFRVAIGWKYNKRTFQIKFCNEMHLCARNYHFGSLVTSNWLAKHYLKDVIMKPNMTLLEMQADVLQRFSVSVSLGKCQRARATAMGMIEGKLEDHYAKAFSDGWSRGCRRVIGLDGSLLKGQVKGEILTAIGRDADNHVYSIASAVVNVENKDNLTWFIDNLVADLDLGAGNRLVVISDKHKVPKPPVPKRKIGRHRKDREGQPIFDQFPPVEPAIPRSDVAPPTVSECGDQVGGPNVPRTDVTPPPVSESGNQVGGPNGMSQETEDVQEQEHDDNEVKVSERLTLQELLMSGYTHADAVAAMEEVYGEVEEQQIEEKEVEEGVEDREVEEEEVEGIQVEQEKVEGIVVEEEGVEESEVGARVLPSRRSYGAYNFHWEKKRKPSERIGKLKLRKMVEDVDVGYSV